MIEDKAKDLGRLIGQSNEYQEVKRAERRAERRQGHGRDCCRRWSSSASTLSACSQRGERPTEAMEKELDVLLGQIQGRATYQRLLVAQENFDKTMARVNDWILDGLEKGAASSIITLG